MPHHFMQGRPRDASESLQSTIARRVFVYNFLGTDPTTLRYPQIEPGDMALNETGRSWVWTGTAWVELETGTPFDHDHNSTDGSGVLTADEHDSYSEYEEVATPSNPDQNSFRFFARASGDSIQVVIRSSQGQEEILATLLDAAPTAGKTLLLLGVKS